MKRPWKGQKTKWSATQKLAKKALRSRTLANQMRRISLTTKMGIWLACWISHITWWNLVAMAPLLEKMLEALRLLDRNMNCPKPHNGKTKHAQIYNSSQLYLQMGPLDESSNVPCSLELISFWKQYSGIVAPFELRIGEFGEYDLNCKFLSLEE